MAIAYRVRFTSKETGRTHIALYNSARRAKEVVHYTYTRHAGAATDAEYLGAFTI